MKYLNITTIDGDSMPIAERAIFWFMEQKTLKNKQATKNVNIGISQAVFVFLSH